MLLLSSTTLVLPVKVISSIPSDPLTTQAFSDFSSLKALAIVKTYFSENTPSNCLLALAGFSKEDIEVEVAQGVLTIKSTKENDAEDEFTLHRGISYRKFNRKFTLADDIVVNDAKLENGLLTINLEQIIPEEKKPKLIEIK